MELKEQNWLGLKAIYKTELKLFATMPQTRSHYLQLQACLKDQF